MGILEEKLLEEELVNSVKKDIEEVYFMNDLPWVIGYSGGKDSTCTTQIIFDTLAELKQSGKKLNKHVYIISSDTMVENPMIVNTIHKTLENIESVAKKIGLPITSHLIRPSFNNTFWSNLIGRGYPCPNQTFRWCTDRMKINPANEFITNIVDKYGEAIMVLGVREGESISRDRVLESHTIDGRKLMKHTTMSNAYVFAPIRPFTIENVWNYLLSNESPWGGNNQELFDLYRESSEDCPLIIDKETKQQGTCGNSRFGCWVCTVVSKDKSLTSFIEKGEKWLIPLLEYRNWLYAIRDDESKRMRRRQDGSIYFSKVLVSNDSIVIPAKGNRKKLIINVVDGKWIDNEGIEWQLFDGANCEDLAKDYIHKNSVNLSNGTNPHILIKRIDGQVYQLGPGPFTFEAREEMLKKLFQLQQKIGNKYEIFIKEELLEIRKLWFKYGVWNDSVSEIYYSVYGKELDNLITDDIRLFDDADMKLLEKVCGKENVPTDLLKDIFNLEKKYMGYNNRFEVSKNIRKILSQEFVHVENGSDENEN